MQGMGWQLASMQQLRLHHTVSFPICSQAESALPQCGGRFWRVPSPVPAPHSHALRSAASLTQQEILGCGDLRCCMLDDSYISAISTNRGQAFTGPSTRGKEVLASPLTCVSPLHLHIEGTDTGAALISLTRRGSAQAASVIARAARCCWARCISYSRRCPDGAMLANR